jgi:streptogramin lyase
MWFLEKIGYEPSSGDVFDVAKSSLNAKGELEVTSYEIPGNATSASLVRGSGENVFIVENFSTSHRILRVTPTGEEIEAAIGEGARPQNAALGPDKFIWFVEEEGKKIGRLAPSELKITRYNTANPTGCEPYEVTRGFGESKMLVRENCPTVSNSRISVVSTK